MVRRGVGALQLPVAEWNFNAFKVLVSGCNGRRRLCQLLEGKGRVRVACICGT
jgi:hypothetical protein